MDIRWFEGLISVAETRSFTRSAGMQNVSVSGLSRRIQSLENWAGADLFDRSGDSPSLTPAGKLLLPQAIDTVRSIRSTRRAIMEMTNPSQQEIKIAAPHIMSAVFFSWWLSAVSEELKSPRIAITSANLPECFCMLKSGDVDIVACLNNDSESIVRRACDDKALNSLEKLCVGTEEMLAVVRNDLIGSEFPMLTFQSDCSLNWAVEDHFHKIAVPSNTLASASLADGLKAMVKGGYGASWLPRRIIENELTSGEFVALSQTSQNIILSIELYKRPAKGSQLIEKLWKLQQNNHVTITKIRASN